MYRAGRASDIRHSLRRVTNDDHEPSDWPAAACPTDTGREAVRLIERLRTRFDNLDPQLHSHAVLANMVQGADGKWRTMSNERLYASKMLLGALYRGELAQGLARLGYGIEKTHADGRFEIADVPRKVVEAFSTRRAAIEAAVAERGSGSTAGNQ